MRKAEMLKTEMLKLDEFGVRGSGGPTTESTDSTEWQEAET